MLSSRIEDRDPCRAGPRRHPDSHPPCHLHLPRVCTPLSFLAKYSANQAGWINSTMYIQHAAQRATTTIVEAKKKKNLHFSPLTITQYILCSGNLHSWSSNARGETSLQNIVDRSSLHSKKASFSNIQMVGSGQPCLSSESWNCHENGLAIDCFDHQSLRCTSSQSSNSI